MTTDHWHFPPVKRPELPQEVHNPVEVDAFNPTILHLFGLDHERRSYCCRGQECRPTNVHGHPIEKVLAGMTRPGFHLPAPDGCLRLMSPAGSTRMSNQLKGRF